MFKTKSSAALSALGACAAVALMSAGPAAAHHSYAMFETSTIELTGTVKDWQFTNPHSWLQIIVLKDGKPTEYSIEGSSPNSLLRRGWSPKTFKPGDKITITVNPLKDGRAGGSFVKAVLPDGTILTQFRQL